MRCRLKGSLPHQLPEDLPAPLPLLRAGCGAMHRVLLPAPALLAILTGEVAKMRLGASACEG
eukprot:550921-Amphidinium_carterae.1